MHKLLQAKSTTYVDLFAFTVWYERMGSTSNFPFGMQKLIDCHFANLSVCGNKSDIPLTLLTFGSVD